MAADARAGMFVSPEFERPPLLEVALAIEFSPIAGFGAIAMATLAALWRDRYPHIEELAPLPPSPPLGASDVPGVMVNVGAPQIRLWLLTRERDRVVQIQRDRLVVNWRAAHDGGPYPRYEEALRPEFDRDLANFVDFAARNDLGPLHMTTTEVTYVNSLESQATADLVGTLRSQTAVPHHLGGPAATRMSQLWNRTSDGQTVGTVTLIADTVGEQSMVTISGRVAVPPPADAQAVLSSLDTAHVDVVTTFVELTTDAAHQTWGRRS